MASKGKRNRKFGRYILLSFLIGLALGCVIFIFAAPYIHNFLQKEEKNTEYSKQETLPQNIKAKEKPKEIPPVRESTTIINEQQIDEQLSENAELIEKTDQMLEGLAELFPADESLPLEIIGKETYISEEKAERIAKEQLIAIWQYKLPSSNKRTLKVDSLLLGSTLEKENTILTVEFWSSPLNYSGYRYQSLHLVLFGVSNKENLLFYYKDKKISFTYRENTVYVTETDEFTPINYNKETNQKDN